LRTTIPPLGEAATQSSIPPLGEAATRSDIVCRSDKLFDAFSGAKVNDICFSADSFHQACEDSAGADFVEVLDAIGEETLHTFLPEYGACQLLCEAEFNIGGGFVVLGADICNGFDGGGFGDAGIGKGFFQGFGGGGHHCGVEGAGYRQGYGFYCSVFRGEVFCSAAGGFGSAEDDLAGAIEIDRFEQAAFAGFCAKLVELLFVEADDADHSAVGCVGGGLHGLASFVDEGEGVVEAQDTCGVKRGVFAEA